MGSVSLDDILITPLSRINTAGGDVLHAMKTSNIGYAGFGEAYFSWVIHDSVKAWKRHTQMTMNLIVPVGNVRFVFHIDGADGFRVEDIGESRYARITVPPGVWFGFKGLTSPQSLVLNVANIMHDPNEAQRLDMSAIEYEWN